MFEKLFNDLTTTRSLAGFLFLAVALLLPQFGYAVPHDGLIEGCCALFGAGNLSEITGLIEKQNVAWEEFKKVNDQRIAELEKKGHAPADLEEKLSKINADLTDFGKQLLGIQAKSNRPGQVGGDDSASLDRKVALLEYYRRGDDTKIREIETKAFNTGSNTDGGYLVGDEMEATIDRVVQTVSAVGRLARTVNISSPLYRRLVKTSGFAARRPGSGGTGGESDNAKYVRLDFTPYEAEIEPHVFNDHLEDNAYDLVADIQGEAEIGFAELAGWEFINGTGVESSAGILSYDTVANASYGWGKLGFIKTGAAGALNSTNPADALIDLQHSLKSAYRPGAAFVMSDTTLATIRQVKDGSGAYYLWQPDAAGGFGGRLLGSPVEIDDYMPAIAANSFSVMYGNLQRGYLVVNRTGITVIRDNITEKGKTKFNFRRRFGGGIQNFEAIKLLKFAS